VRIVRQFGYSLPVNPRQISVQEAFDRHSSVYDERFSRPILGESIRNEVWQIADSELAVARRILDLGCGTGEDAIHYARRGAHVTAVDLSPGMLNRSKAKAAALGFSSSIDCVVAEMTAFSAAAGAFDGVISNFGALNCIEDLSFLRRLCEASLRPGSALVLITMGYFYPLETALFLFKADPRRAFRRLGRSCEVAIEGARLPVYYHSIGSMRRMLGPAFHFKRVLGLRAFLPVPGWEHLQRLTSSAVLRGLDHAWCRFGPTATLADHFVSVWRFQP
jgi:SAM-dependent methyltransferase